MENRRYRLIPALKLLPDSDFGHAVVGIHESSEYASQNQRSTWNLARVFIQRTHAP